MSQKITYYCDGCGAEKKEVNHWYAASVAGTNFMVGELKFSVAGDRVYCGQQCLIKALSEHLEKMK